MKNDLHLVPDDARRVYTVAELTRLVSGYSIGFLVNFNVKHMREGIRRMVLNHPTSSLRAPSRPSR